MAESKKALAIRMKKEYLARKQARSSARAGKGQKKVKPIKEGTYGAVGSIEPAGGIMSIMPKKKPAQNRGNKAHIDL